MDSPRISVIIPAFNAAATLGEQLEALAAQALGEPWEVVIADNGSTDATVSLVQAWASQAPFRLRLVDASARIGAAHARNRGAEEASGDILIFVDADDIVSPGWLQSMAQATSRHALVSGGTASITPSHTGNRPGAPARTRWSGLLSSAGFMDAASSANLAVQRQLWDRIGGFREDFVACEDTAFCWDAQFAGESIHREPGAVVRSRSRSSLRGLWRQQYQWGIGAVQLYVTFKARGAPPSSTMGAILRWGGLVAMFPRAILDTHRRADWVGRAARRAGRLAGSLRFRVIHL